VEVAGGLYHVIVRGNERRNVFRDDGEAFSLPTLSTSEEPPVVPRGFTAERIARTVARLQGLELIRMRGRSQDRESSRARVTVAWLGREIARIPIARAARFFGRDTSTMINAVNKLESEMERKLALRQRLHGIREELRRSANNPISKD
jgi:chromosomal replication initiation ATPase DnaA